MVTWPGIKRETPDAVAISRSMTVREIDVRITVAAQDRRQSCAACGPTNPHPYARSHARFEGGLDLRRRSVPVCGMLTTRGASRRILNHCGALSSLTRSAPKLRRMVDNVRRCALAYEARGGKRVSNLWFESVLLPDGWATGVRLTLAQGRIERIEIDTAPRDTDERHNVGVPGLPCLHSHAFQRGLAGLTERH